MKRTILLVAMLVFIVVLVGCKQPAPQSPRQIEVPTPSQPQPIEEPKADPYAECVQAALSQAEQCLLAGGDSMACKAQSEAALKDCERLR